MFVLFLKEEGGKEKTWKGGLVTELAFSHIIIKLIVITIIIIVVDNIKGNLRIT